MNFNEKDRYSELLSLITDFLDGKIESAEFEEKSRLMYTTSAYLVYTIDKLTQALVKQVFYFSFSLFLIL